MTAWAFIAFSLIFAALVFAHFVFAYRAWGSSRAEQSSDIDPDYVRMEDYFARSFRAKVDEWLKLPVQMAGPDGSRRLRKGREFLQLTPGSLSHPPQSHSDDIQVVQGTFFCGAGCIFHREIYAQKEALIGAGSRLQAIAVDGDLAIGASVRIARWADSTGEMEIGRDSVVRARATAGKSIHLQKGVQAGSLFAPVVSTSLKGLEGLERAEEPLTPLVEVPVAGNAGVYGRGPEGLGMDPARMHPLGPESVLYLGDLKPRIPIRLKKNLIVKGDCIVPAGSVLEADLKADGLLVIGDSSICRGNVIGNSNVLFGKSSSFLGVVHAGKTLFLGKGVCGGHEGTPVAAYATERLLVEEDVTVHGKLVSGDRVVVAPEPRAGNLW